MREAGMQLTRDRTLSACQLFAPPHCSVIGGLFLSTPGSKELNMLNLTLTPGSRSRIDASTTRVNDALHWWMQSNSSLEVLGGATIHANRPADETGQPCLHVDSEAELLFHGGAGERAWSSLEIMHMASMRVQREGAAGATGGAPFETVLSGGLKSSPDSLIQVSDGATLTSYSPANMTGLLGSTFGAVDGAGALAIAQGQHSFTAPVNVSHFQLLNGRVEVFEQMLAHTMEIVEGEMLLHGYAFANNVRLSRP